MNRRQFVAAAAGCAGPVLSASSRAAAAGLVGVNVQSTTQPPHAIANARVFVLSRAGRELGSAQTGRTGEAILPAINEADGPKYLLVEHPAYFISGLTWLSGMEEYFILATGLVVR
jgi:hypothetical protein